MRKQYLYDGAIEMEMPGYFVDGRYAQLLYQMSSPLRFTQIDYAECEFLVLIARFQHHRSCSSVKYRIRLCRSIYLI